MMDNISAETLEKILAVIEHVSNMIGVNDACKRAGIGKTRFFEVLHSSNELANKYTLARAISAELFADDVQTAARTVNDPHKARNIMMANQWSAAKFNPKRYSEKIQVDHSHQIDLTKAIEEGNQRAAIPMRDLSPLAQQEMPTLSDTYTELTTGSEPVASEEKPVESTASTNSVDDIFS